MKMTKESLLKVIGAADDVISTLAGTNDEFHKDDTDKMVRLWDDLNDQYAPPEVVRELARLALATMDSEPVAWTWHYREQWHVTNDERRAEFVAKDGDVAVLPLYRHAQPAPEKYNIGDATMRHIFTPTGMTTVSDMQAVFDRVEAVLVGMEQPVPVVPVTDAMAYAFHHALTDSPLGDDDVEDIKAGLRAALVNGFNSQPAPVVPDDLLSMAASAIEDLLEHTDPNTSYYSGVWADVPGKLRAAMFQAKSLTGNSPVIGIDQASGPDRTVEVHYVAPPGYVMVPKEPTEAMMLHNSGCQHHAWDDPDCAMRQTRRLIWSHMLAAAPQEVK
ncbi:TPA: hypothetical protein M2O88_005013 [Klebsiella variicola]|nr:hypothetical protein [Klebsiella variicola]HDK6149617.1 hypothetical protein [Klebsiella variicola]